MPTNNKKEEEQEKKKKNRKKQKKKQGKQEGEPEAEEEVVEREHTHYGDLGLGQTGFDFITDDDKEFDGKKDSQRLKSNSLGMNIDQAIEEEVIRDWIEKGRKGGDKQEKVRERGDKRPVRQRRTRIQVVREILEICREPRRPTQIMQMSALDYNHLRRYLHALEERQLLHRRGKSYSLTEKGRSLSRRLKAILDELGPVLSS